MSAVATSSAPVPPCTDEPPTSQGISEQIHAVDAMGVFWRKTQ